MLLALLLAQPLSASAILQDAWTKVNGAKSMTVTLLRTTEEFGHQHRRKYAWRKGGYFWSQNDAVIDVGNPKGGFTYESDKKIYQVREPLDPYFTLVSYLDLDVLHAGWHVIGQPKPMAWHGKKTVRIELDGRKALTKETKFFLFFDPKSHLPIAISANLGSVTQVSIFEDLRINPQIPDNLFHFTPPKGWKRVTEKTGGWS